MDRTQLHALAHQSAQERQDLFAEPYYIDPDGRNVMITALSTAPNISHALSLGGYNTGSDLTMRLTADCGAPILGSIILRGRDNRRYRLKEIDSHPISREQVWTLVAA